MLVLRGHHLLCLPRFQGHGYSKSFTANMSRIAKDLAEHPEQLIRVADKPDDICRACPHLGGEVCGLDDGQSRARERDRRVLALLGKKAGDVFSYAHARELLATAFLAVPLQEVCAECNWLDLCLRFSEQRG